MTIPVGIVDKAAEAYDNHDGRHWDCIGAALEAVLPDLSRLPTSGATDVDIPGLRKLWKAYEDAPPDTPEHESTWETYAHALFMAAPHLFAIAEKFACLSRLPVEIDAAGLEAAAKSLSQSNRCAGLAMKLCEVPIKTTCLCARDARAVITAYGRALVEDK